MNFGECIFLKRFSNHGCDSASEAEGRTIGSFEKHFFKKSITKEEEYALTATQEKVLVRSFENEMTETADR